MKKDIILAGVGGQGILTIAAVLGRAALSSNLDMKQAEVHGMAQRGGAVQSHFRISDTKVHSDLIPIGAADLILAMEPMESLRYLPWLGSEGWVITNNQPVININNYPELEELHAAVAALPNQFMFDGVAIAREAGAPRALNMAVLGAGSPCIGIDAAVIEQAIADQFASKGDVIIEKNIAVFRAARELALADMK